MQTDDLDQLQSLLRRLANREKARSEATIQADVRQVLLAGGLGLAEDDLDVRLETQVGDRRRIDVEVGFTVIEVKRDLRSESTTREAVKQLSGYVKARTLQTGQRYVGILTDGLEWRAYHLRGDQLSEVTRHEVKHHRPDALAFLYWLEGVLATQDGIRPTPAEISERLGAASASHALDRATLSELYAEYGQMPTVRLKRELWARLLKSALGTQFQDDDALFLEHTLLVNSAEIIAHLVVGIRVADYQPATLLGGRLFEKSQIHGVVEQDFFDWVLEVPEGDRFVRALARRLARFDWAHVDHDVLKVLYESVIGAETRKSLGEYYTPDWLAEHVVSTVVDDPLHQRVLDPSCGSGTFLFHAVRRYLEVAESSGVSLPEALQGLSGKVQGIDLHPVAVTLARVTYLLAIGQDRLKHPKRPPISVPVYLGDTIQWQQQQIDLFNDDGLLIKTGTGDGLVERELRFPGDLMADAGRFDQLVTSLANLAAKPRTANSMAVLRPIFNRLAIPENHHQVVAATFALMCDLHDDGRDHIWSYYVRNLARPIWLSRPENRVDVLVGNPPWLAYRHMPADMQLAFQEMSQARGLWHGREVATQQDLSGLFVARSVQQYLRKGGRFGFVLPNAALDRGHFEGFRSGRYSDPSEITEIAFTHSWDLRRLRPHFFPRGSCVVFGTRAATGDAARLPVTTTRWTGRIPRTREAVLDVVTFLTRESAQLVVSGTDETGGSPYRPRFFNGATIYPRFLFFVEKEEPGVMGWGAGRVAVRSVRGTLDRAPWKDVDLLEGVVESEFLRPVLLGESIVPYRVLAPRLAVLPIEGSTLLSGEDPRLDMYPDLADWWRKAESVWMEHRASERQTLLQQLDQRRKLTIQLPTSALRVVYGKAGMHVVATLVDDQEMIIDHKLYWATVTSRDEADYLCAILNSPVLTELVRPLMSYGKDERDIDKHIWKLPIPLFDPTDADHQRLAELGSIQREAVQALGLEVGKRFVQLRQQVRGELEKGLAAVEIGERVRDMLAS